MLVKFNLFVIGVFVVLLIGFSPEVVALGTAIVTFWDASVTKENIMMEKRFDWLGKGERGVADSERSCL